MDQKAFIKLEIFSQRLSIHSIILVLKEKHRETRAKMRSASLESFD